MNQDNRKWWLDDARNVSKIYYGLWILCGILVAADFFYDKHGYFSFEEWFGFHAGFGFIACVGLVLVSKQLRRLLKRSEDYYDR